ncbi:unnamed protein product, partial [Dicrocoelium dendriticum]
SLDMETVHIVLTLSGKESIEFAEVMIKSMLYFQGRFKADEQICRTDHFPQREQQCPSGLPLRPSLIVFHVLIDFHSRSYFADIFKAWHRPYLRWRFYRTEYYDVKFLQLLRKLHCNHHSGVPSLMKLMVPNILPLDVEKVIIMDSDMLFNHNVLEMWELFYEFNESQERGVNGGLSLFHLTKLRKIRWHEKWQEASKRFFERNVVLAQADQVSQTLAIGE